MGTFERGVGERGETLLPGKNVTCEPNKEAHKMERKRCIDFACLLKVNVRSLINFVALPEDVNAL